MFPLEFNKINFVEENKRHFIPESLALMGTASPDLEKQGFFAVVFIIGNIVDSRIKLQKNNNFMKNTFRILLLSFLFVACQQKIKPEDVSKINGYWEIEKVVVDGTNAKEYGINESYDYFQIDKNNMGFRKKVMPQLDGSFIVNDSQEDVKVRFKDGEVFFDYVTPYAKWSEELIAISDKELVFKNAEKKEYHYKKAEPLNTLNDGKKTK